MYPQTPNKNSKKVSCLTPSFTFGTLGSSPSSFFVSPKNLNLLNSLSPHHLFNKFCRSSDENAEHQAEEDGDFEFPEKKRAKASGEDALAATTRGFMLSPFTESHASQNFNNESTTESIETADSADIWSFANDTHTASMNLSVITEATEAMDDKDIFYSPCEDNKILEQSPIEGESMSSNLSQTHSENNGESKDSQASGKRKMSDVQSTPCSKLSSRIQQIQSPPRTLQTSFDELLKDPRKVWSKDLDEELMRCFRKYMKFKQSHGMECSRVLKGTSQNKVLSRMLEKKTGILRTQKQISGRVLKLLKTGNSRILSKPPAERILKDQEQVLFAKATSSKTSPSPIVTKVEGFNMSFRYKDQGQKSHVFTCLSENEVETSTNLSIGEARDRLPQMNQKFLADYDEIASVLNERGVNVHLVSCDVNLKSDFIDSSSPVSPMTNPKQFVSENGNFVSYLKVHLRDGLLKKPFISLKSQTTVYKDSSQMLFRSEELINGYRDGSDGYRLDVPFLNQFWAGFLTFMVNGTSDFEDLQNLVISQLIYDDDGPEKKTYGFFVFRFTPNINGEGSTSVNVISLTEKSNQTDFDDLETILASSPLVSSPFIPSLAKHDSCVQPSSLHACLDADARVCSTLDPTLLHENSVNYEFSKSTAGCQERPSLMVSKSSTDINFENRPISRVLPHGNQSFTLGNRNHSAGQIGSFFKDPSSRSEDYHCNHPQTLPLDGRYPHVTQCVQPPTNNNSHMHIPQSLPFNHLQQLQQMQPMQFNGQEAFPPYPVCANTTSGTNYAKEIWAPPPFHQFPPQISSAPASQMHFFVQGDTPVQESEKKKKRSGAPLKIKSILRYDPSKRDSPETNSKNSKGAFHSFRASPPGPVFRYD